MTLDGLVLACGILVLVAGADVLIRGGSALARRLGLTPLVIGLTVVAFGTSAPELVVSVVGAWQGRGDVALGNVVGSNIFNIGVILGLAVLISPFDVKLGLLKLDAPLMVGVTILGAGVAGLDPIPRWCGIVLLASLVGYTVFSVLQARRETDRTVRADFDKEVANALGSAWVEVGLIVAGLVLLVLGSRWMVGSAASIARSLGASEALIGLTVVAAGTSMPELATSTVAAFRGHGDLAIGNIIGSNIFNILGILGLAASVSPFSAPGIAGLDLAVMLAFALGLQPLLWTGRRLQRWEGALLLVGYAVYLRAIWLS